MAIQIQEGFQLGSANPIDSRMIADTYIELESIRAYPGLLVYVKSEQCFYLYYGEAEGWGEFPKFRPKHYSLIKETISVVATQPSQKVFNIPKTSQGFYESTFDVVIGSVFLSETRYTVRNNQIILNDDEEGLDIGRTVDFRFCYLTQSSESETQMLKTKQTTPKKTTRKKKATK